MLNFSLALYYLFYCVCIIMYAINCGSSRVAFFFCLCSCPLVFACVCVGVRACVYRNRSFLIKPPHFELCYFAFFVQAVFCHFLAVFACFVYILPCLPCLVLASPAPTPTNEKRQAGCHYLLILSAKILILRVCVVNQGASSRLGCLIAF